ncbi:unnamed protein product [Polarella glacialis]|uniref:FAST kinase leucine-rich domain-containing protein n=1 Tax=Polarella glacialis TaxID=89957 RepID=A0A813ESV1_POLGL|nr:unnamed protein product [Polarella glacialis]
MQAPLGSGFVGRKHQPSRTSSTEWRRSKGWNSPSWWDLQLSLGIVAQGSAQGVLDFCNVHLAQLHLVNVATALHRIAKAPDKLKAIENIGLQSVIDRIFALLQDGSVDKQPVSLANIFWACAKMGYVDLPLYDVIVEETMRHLVELDCQECSNMCWAFASLELFHGPLLTQLRIRAMDLIPRFDLQDLSNTSWALAKLGVLRSAL